jgi:hypothetical protein
MRYFIFSFLGLMLVGCSIALTPVLSLKEEGADPEYRMSEPSSKLRFHLTNDEEFIYLFLNTNDPVTCRKILQTGLKIYFDPKGREGTNCYVEYPKLERLEIDQEATETTPDLRKLRKAVSDDASYKKINTAPERFDAMLSRLDMEVNLEIEDSTELNYRLKMPMKWIAPEGKVALENLSFGVRSGSFSMPAKFEITGGGVQAGNNTTMPGMPGNRNQGGTTQRPDPSGYTSPIEFWYAIELSR